MPCPPRLILQYLVFPDCFLLFTYLPQYYFFSKSGDPFLTANLKQALVEGNLGQLTIGPENHHWNAERKGEEDE